MDGMGIIPRTPGRATVGKRNDEMKSCGRFAMTTSAPATADVVKWVVTPGAVAGAVEIGLFIRRGCGLVATRGAGRAGAGTGGGGGGGVSSTGFCRVSVSRNSRSSSSGVRPVGAGDSARGRAGGGCAGRPCFFLALMKFAATQMTSTTRPKSVSIQSVLRKTSRMLPDVRTDGGPLHSTACLRRPPAIRASRCQPSHSACDRNP